jgi:hypothetical protein
MPSDVKFGKITCIPKKSLIIGQVIQVQKAKVGKNGLLQLKFEAIQFPDGWSTQLSAHVWNRDGQGVIGGETTKRVNYRKVPHYVEDMGIFAQLVETGSRAMGKGRFIPVGAECIIVLDNDLEIKCLEKL